MPKPLTLKKLESFLEDVDVFEKPKWKLEQYPTTPHIAACMLHMIHNSYNDIKDKHVLDLGCGCGVLSIGASMLGARKVTGIDIDEDALKICQKNIEFFEFDNIDLVKSDVNCPESQVIQQLSGNIDTVIMNPPFGTKQQGIDMIFLKTAIDLTSGAVYSLHKKSTIMHIKKIAEEWNVNMEVLAELQFDIKNTLAMHKKNSVDVEVYFVRFTHKQRK